MAASNILLIVNVSQRSLVIQTLQAQVYGHLCYFHFSVKADDTQVIVAFLFTGWLTFGLAAILGYQGFTDDRRALKGRLSSSRASRNIKLHLQSDVGTSIQAVPVPTSTELAFEPPAPSPGPLYGLIGEERSLLEEKGSRWVEISKGILAPLCDLQVATGTAILVASLAQGSNLSYYHELLITSYWNITLNSFWAAQISNPKYCEINDLPSRIRNVTVLCSAILSVYIQVRATIHQYWPGYWDPFQPGRCYLLHHDHSGERQSWLWIAGLSIYCFVLVIRMLPIRQDFFEYISFYYLDDKIEEYFTKPRNLGVERPNESTSYETRRNGHGTCTLQRYPYLKIPCRILAFLVTNFLAVWCYGAGSFGMETIAILGYLSWNTLDVIDAKISNLHLIEPPGSEMSWGFGQVLSLVLLVTILFSALDVFGEVKEKKKE
jgi:hypothetical protein